MQKIFPQGNEIKQFIENVREHPRLFVITGAGISTASGIPDYRDKNGDWKRKSPELHQDFIQSEQVRQRYWARSLIGWRFFGSAKPNTNHIALQQLESSGQIQQLVTQNVDGLHQRAGSIKVIDLHGTIDTVSCLSCTKDTSRSNFQLRLEQSNPSYAEISAEIAPDGDADLDQHDFSDFIIPECLSCGGVNMPKVVFYGGSVPRPVIEKAYENLEKSDAVLVLGTSLMVYSAYQFCRHAAKTDKPVFAINLGKTRHDGQYQMKLDMPCEEVLGWLTD